MSSSPHLLSDNTYEVVEMTEPRPRSAERNTLTQSHTLTRHDEVR